MILFAPTSVLPRIVGEDEGGGLNGAQLLNSLDVLNLTQGRRRRP
jgi:hypothetical protein